MAENRGLVRNFTYSEQAREVIRGLIFDGTYKPGQRLKEAEVSRDLGISRAPTREAIQSLANEGLVELIPHRGAVVTTFDLARVQELCEIREALETMAVRLASERITTEQIRTFDDFMDRTAEIVDSDETAPYPETLNFHNRIFEIAGNATLRNMAAEVHAQLRLAMLRSGAAPGRASKAYREHRDIFDAIRKRNPGEAEDAMRKHLRSGLENMKSTLFANGTEDL